MAALNQLASVPIIDIGALINNSSKQQEVAEAIGRACRDCGFFYITNHGIHWDLQTRLEALSHQFFALSEPQKMQISMARGGHAWRGYFPVGGELTSGLPDIKEGIYFGAELAATHPRVRAQLPLHGANLFPAEPQELKSTVLEYMQVMTELGHTLMRGIALSLGLPDSFFRTKYTNDPLVLFRIFNYPPPSAAQLAKTPWGVGEHTDYGVLTILKQDDCGGLQVKSKSGWVEAPPIHDAFVCNIGDMLEKMTGGLYRSTPHRVQNVSGRTRLSFPFFFDPNFDAKIEAIPLKNNAKILHGHEERWDKTNVHDFKGTYGEYLVNKVSKVFPQLGKKVLN